MSRPPLVARNVSKGTLLAERLEDIGGAGAAAVGLAGLSEAHDSFAVNDERRGVGGLLRRIPSQAPTAGELEVRIEDEGETRRYALAGHELLGVVRKAVGGARIYQHEARLGCLEIVRASDELPHLLRADRTLVARPAAQDDEDYRSFSR